MWKDPFEEMKKFRRDMNRLFDSFFSRFGIKEKTGERILSGEKERQLFREPLSDLKETRGEIIAHIELPGVDKKDIQLTITENNLEVRVRKKQKTKIEKKGYIREERAYKGFYRSIGLPTRIIPEKAKASYKNGILEIIMPKAEKKKMKKKEVKVE